MAARVGAESRMPYDGAMQAGPRAWRVGLTALVLVVGAFGFGPNDEAMEYSKQLYAEGEKAMEEKDYARALANYKEGYRYAPTLHIFTFNIATAADLSGDCATAKKYFQHFVDLVPDHDKHAASKKRLDELNKTCTASLPEPVVPGASGDQDERKSRRDIEAERALNLALSELYAAAEAYKAAGTRHKATRQIGRAGRRKKRHAKRMKKHVLSLGVEIRPVERKSPGVAEKPTDACRYGRAQENRIVSAMNEVMEYYDDDDTYRVLRRFIRWSERIDRPAFEECG